MALVAAKCTQCGADLQVDPAQEAAICPFCKTAFITEKAINNYVTNNVTNIGNLNADVVNIVNDPAEELHNAGRAHMDMGEEKRAADSFRKMIERFPGDWRGYYGLLRASSGDFSRREWRYLDRGFGQPFRQCHGEVMDLFRKMETAAGTDPTARSAVSEVRSNLCRYAQEAGKESLADRQAAPAKVQAAQNELDGLKARLRNMSGAERNEGLHRGERTATIVVVSVAFVLWLVLTLTADLAGDEQFGRWFYYPMNGLDVLCGRIYGSIFLKLAGIVGPERVRALTGLFLYLVVCGTASVVVFFISLHVYLRAKASGRRPYTALKFINVMVGIQFSVMFVLDFLLLFMGGFEDIVDFVMLNVFVFDPVAVVLCWILMAEPLFLVNKLANLPKDVMHPDAELRRQVEQADQRLANVKGVVSQLDAEIEKFHGIYRTLVGR